MHNRIRGVPRTRRGCRHTPRTRLRASRTPKRVARSAASLRPGANWLARRTWSSSSGPGRRRLAPVYGTTTRSCPTAPPRSPSARTPAACLHAGSTPTSPRSASASFSPACATRPRSCSSYGSFVSVPHPVVAGYPRANIRWPALGARVISKRKGVLQYKKPDRYCSLRCPWQRTRDGRAERGELGAL